MEPFFYGAVLANGTTLVRGTVFSQTGLLMKQTAILAPLVFSVFPEFTLAISKFANEKLASFFFFLGGGGRGVYGDLGKTYVPCPQQTACFAKAIHNFIKPLCPIPMPLGSV